MSFSPRNGEVILKFLIGPITVFIYEFQSPQWGSNSKVLMKLVNLVSICFSPRNGEVILKEEVKE